MKTLNEYPAKILLGTVDNENIYLLSPEWSCGWYWGFGYLGNINCHYHLDGISKDKNLYDGLKDHFGNTLKIKESDIWKFAELVKTAYILKEYAELVYSGGAHYTTNPCKDIIKNNNEFERINKIVLPAIFDEIYKLLERNKNNELLYKKLNNIILTGDTSKVYKFMIEKGLKTDDIKDKVSKLDYNIIHSFYWKEYHKNKKS